MHICVYAYIRRRVCIFVTNLHIYTNVHTLVCMNVHIRRRMYAYAHICIYIHVSMCTYIGRRICTRVYVHLCKSVNSQNMHIHGFVCMYTYAQICIFIYSHTYSHMGITASECFGEGIAVCMYTYNVNNSLRSCNSLRICSPILLHPDFCLCICM